MENKLPQTLLVLVALYALASLVHFIHNAEFLSNYPGLPEDWTRAGVYLAWIGMTAVGALGVVLLSLGFTITGLLALAIYALLGMDSLGHYVLAPFSHHTAAMNATILFEVGAGTLVLVEVIRQTVAHLHDRPPTT